MVVIVPVAAVSSGGGGIKLNFPRGRKYEFRENISVVYVLMYTINTQPVTWFLMKLQIGEEIFPPSNFLSFQFLNEKFHEK